MAPGDKAVDFYIVLLQFASIAREQWLICAKPGSECLAVDETRSAAIAHARRMAEYHVSADRSVQIHEQQDGLSWKTIWCSPDSVPKYP
jgi:hypothetical protein